MKLKLWLFLVIGLTVFQACKKSSKDFNSDPSLFKDHITSYTSGLISTKNPIQVGLQAHTDQWKANQEIDEKLFSISPKVSGKIVYLANNSLSFIPEKKLDQNQEYQVTFHLSKISEVPKELRDFKFTVKTTKMDFAVETWDFQSVGENYYFLNGTITTSDWMSTEQANELITAKTGSVKNRVKLIGKTEEARFFSFVIDSIPRGATENTLAVQWDGKSQKIDQKGSIELAIPAKNSFKIIQTKISDDSNQSFWINFSDPIKRNQDFSGLIALEHTDDIKFSVDGNSIKVFSDTPFDGEIPISLFQGIENVYGKKTAETTTVKLLFEQQKPAVKMAKNGTILPSSENLKVNFQVTNLKAVDVKIYKIFENNVLQFLQDNELDGKYNLRKVAAPIAKQTIDLSTGNLSSLKKWSTHALDISSLIRPEPGAIYRIEFSFKKSYSLFHCATTDGEDAQQTEEAEDDTEEEDWDEDDYYDYYDYNWEEKDDPCSNSYYYDTKVATNILASDLGVMVKKGLNNSYFFAVNNIITTEPVSNASIAIYDYQQQLLTTIETNTDGLAHFNLDKKGYFVIVKKDNHTTYVKLDDGLALAVSNFDVDGVSLQKGLNGFIYTERGVWRPGDLIHVGFILNDLSNPLPDNHPIKIKLSDPFGKVSEQKIQSKNKDNHYSFTLSTPENAPTGNWEAVISVGGAKFYKQIKVETIKPNRLKIKNDMEGKLIASTGSRINFNINWLQGAIAKNLKAEVQAKLVPQDTQFKGFEKYTFTNSFQSKSPIELNLFSGKTDDAGNFSFFVKPESSLENSGMLKMILVTKIHENGGDFSTDVSTSSYSPYTSYVGIAAPKGNKYGMLETDTKNTFNVVSVTESGNRKAQAAVQIDVYKVNWNWWWDASDDNMSNYSASNNHKTYFSTRIQTNASGLGQFDLTVAEADWGRYRIVATDISSGHIASQDLYIDWPIWSGKTKDHGNAEAIVLNIATDKTDYNLKEEAQISFPSSEGGRALISVETGTEVLETHWVKTTKGETIFKLPIRKEMAPNVYLNITLLQPHASTVNDSPIRLYGIVPITVHNKETKLQPVITMSETLRPEQKANIQIQEATGQEMTYTIAVVEDGLLDLTRFKTPNPWSNFYSKTALGVKTWDIYNEVIGAFGGTINQVFSIGGDEDLGGGQAKKANRFKPVVIYMGPFKLEKGKRATHEITLPKYIGSVRTMVVASNAKTMAYGSAEKTTVIKSPLMILGSLPRQAVPTEKVTLPVTVFATEPQIKQVSVRVKVDGKFQLLGNATQSVSFTQPDEKIVYFELEVGKTSGKTKIVIEATSGKEKASYEVEMQVANPNPRTYKNQDIVIEPNETAHLDWTSFGETGSNQAQLEISSFPGVNLSSRLNYLIAYPHGCSEQITSGVFPQLYLADFMELTKEQKDNVQRNVAAGINRLKQNQLSDGGFTYWSGSKYYDDWSTSYIGHFFIEAEKKGFILPVNSKSNWLSFQQKTARQWRYQARYRNDFAQAYRLYTLALAGSPDLAAMNRLRETQGISNESKLRLAAAYALAGQKSAAEKLMANTSLDGMDNYYYYGSPERNQAMALETYLVLGQKDKAHRLALEIAKNLSSSRWMSTQTSAYSLYAIALYAKGNNSADGIDLQTTYRGKTETVKTKKAFIDQRLSVSNQGNTIAFKNNSKSTLYARVAYSGILPVGEELVQQNGLVIQSAFKNSNGQLIYPQTITQGSEFSCEITITNATNRRVDNVALTQIVPSGWEIANLRFTDVGESANQVDHTDIRDDRTNLYFSLPANTAKRFKIVLNASYLGRYYMPGIQAEAMYDHNYSSRTQGMWVEVVK
ncbi:alpha-2-macroglobulin family protein [Flavobacterium sp. JP2137]|uniref:alpha-2-macroglobulin family protein n=1 Tax=Flavobacterium sp. JP2137 TaxID=3414510 RepID=UPI003D3016F4